jgi:hypothetical protein
MQTSLYPAKTGQALRDIGRRRRAAGAEPAPAKAIPVAPVSRGNSLTGFSTRQRVQSLRLPVSVAIMVGGLRLGVNKRDAARGLWPLGEENFC